jgi:2,4-dienoyl-CoA reductase-like NADH-dependent reductase (Old Yellow Enzyme family)
VHYHAERAKGGFGLIVTGQVSVHPTHGTVRPAGYLDEIGPEFRMISDAVHEHGAKVVMQLNHNGRGRASGSDDWTPVLSTNTGPSWRPGLGGEFTREIDVVDIAEITAGFAKTARNMERSGFDGIEIHSGAGMLLSEFLLPTYNQRTDQYGGALENRSRFLMEIIEAVRREVGREFVVGVRMNTEWPIPDGWTLTEAIELAQRLEATGQVDFLDVEKWDIQHSMGGSGTPFGMVIPLASQVKKAVPSMAIFVAGRIVEPVMADGIIADGHADMVAMARASIADPEWPNKAREGRVDDIRRCIGASQGCFQRHTNRYSITCTQNPRVGREEMWGIGTLKPAAVKKRVLIAGAGPAGMEAAIVAAERGHDVILCELGSDVGGQVNLIVKSPRRAEFIEVIEWRRNQIRKLKIDLRLNTTVTPELVEQISPDAVVVATGSIPNMNNVDPSMHWSPSKKRERGIAGADRPNVYSSWDVLHGALDNTRHVVLLDGVGYYQSSDPLEYLVARGIKVTAMAVGGVFATDMILNDRPIFTESLQGKDVTFHQFTTLVAIRAGSVRAREGQTGREFDVDGVDAVVLSLGNVAANALYYALRDTAPELYRIGDCMAPRRIEHAHFEGHRVGRQL